MQKVVGFVFRGHTVIKHILFFFAFTIQLRADHYNFRLAVCVLSPVRQIVIDEFMRETAAEVLNPLMGTLKPQSSRPFQGHDIIQRQKTRKWYMI